MKTIYWKEDYNRIYGLHRGTAQIRDFYWLHGKGFSVRKYWDNELLQYVFYALLINLAVCIIGFFLNMLRHKRKTDKISKSIIILGVVNVLGIIWYLARSIKLNIWEKCFNSKWYASFMADSWNEITVIIKQAYHSKFYSIIY